MNHFLGIFPDKETNLKISKVLANVGKIFENQQIPINYVERDSYHITLIFFGVSLNILRKRLLSLKLRGFTRKSFELTIQQARLGISRNDREILFMPIMDGADQLREMVYDISRLIGNKRDRKFIPHITLGRIRKDLSDEEYRNLTQALGEMNSRLLSKITFRVDEFYLARTENRHYKLLRKFSI